MCQTILLHIAPLDQQNRNQNPEESDAVRRLDSVQMSKQLDVQQNLVTDRGHMDFIADRKLDKQNRESRLERFQNRENLDAVQQV